MNEQNLKQENIELSPALDLLGFELINGDKDKGTVCIKFHPKDSLLTTTGYVQGGFLAAMLDTTMILAFFTCLEAGESASTLEMKVSFIKPTKQGTFTGEGRMVYRGKQIGFLEGDLKDSKGNLLAKATATAKVISDPRLKE